jgi:chromosome segregation ATPase
MTELMKSIRDMQTSGQAREEEANKLRREAEHRVNELEKSLAVTKGELNVFLSEKSTLKDTLESTKAERREALDNLKDSKEKVDDLKDKLNSAQSQLTLEVELRARSEQKEAEERNERIALSAQMVAMTKEQAHMETTLTEAKEGVEQEWRSQLKAQTEKYEEKEKELAKSRETIIGLRAEIETLQISLAQEKSEAIAENAQEMSKLQAEINILKERMRAEEMRVAVLNNNSEAKVHKLESQIREGAAERRRCVIQKQIFCCCTHPSKHLYCL